VVTAVLVFVWSARDRGDAGSLVQTVAAVLVPAVGVLGWLWARWRADAGAVGSLDLTADGLAEHVRMQWERAAGERRLLYPAPVRVRWQWASVPVTGCVGEALGGAHVLLRRKPLPGMGAVTEATLAEGGGLDDLLAVWGGLGSGRLVVVGAPGSGKSGAAIRLLLDALEHRRGLGGLERSEVPVPLLLTVHGWDPERQQFEEWLAVRLAGEYVGWLGPGADRLKAARHLIDSGRVSVLLDGLDELPEAQRPAALRALDELTRLRLVALTRTREMAEAVAVGRHLTGAAALELLPVSARDAAAYLQRCQVQPAPAAWQNLVKHLRRWPSGPLARAMDTPLMLSLVRDTYVGSDRVDDLADEVRFPTRQMIEDHLLDRVLPVAYQIQPGQPAPRYSAEQAGRWLAYVAGRMNEDGTRALAWWWDIPRWAATWPRIGMTALVWSVGSCNGITPRLCYAWRGEPWGGRCNSIRRGIHLG
jgi:hypothetical protein